VATKSAKERIGSVFAGRYRLDEVLGQGATGTVYAATDQTAEDGGRVAVKIFHGEGGGAERAEQLLSEARSAAAIGHTAVVDVLDSGRDDEGTPYLVMERLDAETLRDAIDRGDLAVDVVVDVAAQVLDGLAATHARDIVHRDVKPSSIFVERDGDTMKARLAGFGAIADVESEEMRTLAYVSPEEVRGEKLDRRSDVWSCGAVLFHALSGRPPFEAESRQDLLEAIREQEPPPLASVTEDLPEWLLRIVDTALSRDPAKRFQHASQMSIALRNRGEAPMSLDWEGYEDATMRTSSLYDAPDDGEPATAPNPDETGPSMAVDAAQLTGPSTETDREDARADTDRPPPLSTATPPWIWAILLLVAAMIAYFLVR
jgi:serine/threonine-protein kinase